MARIKKQLVAVDPPGLLETLEIVKLHDAFELFPRSA
jgi:hypothetical protein